MSTPHEMLRPVEPRIVSIASEQATAALRDEAIARASFAASGKRVLRVSASNHVEWLRMILTASPCSSCAASASPSAANSTPSALSAASAAALALALASTNAAIGPAGSISTLPGTRTRKRPISGVG